MGIRIELDNKHGTYSAGGVVSGHVRPIPNAGPHRWAKLKVTEITVKLVGRQTTTLERRPWESVSNWKRKHCPETRVLVEPENRLVNTDGTCATPNLIKELSPDGDDDDGDCHTSLEETIVYPFSFLLPENLPPSFKSPKVEISYFLEAVRKRSLFYKKRHDHTKLPFTITETIDLNSELEGKLPDGVNAMQGNFVARKLDNLGFCLQLPTRSCFVPGEVVEFNAFIDTRNSCRDVNGVEASIVQLIKYNYAGQHPELRSESIEDIVISVQGPSLEVGESEVWKPGDLLLPVAMPPSHLGRGGILASNTPSLIKVQYFLRLELHITGWGRRELSGQLPIFIGTIPLDPTLPGFVPPDEPISPEELLSLAIPQWLPETDIERDASDQSYGSLTSEEIAMMRNFSLAEEPSAPIEENQPSAPLMETYVVPTAPDNISLYEGPQEYSMSPPRYEDVAAPPSYSEAVELE